MALSVLVRAGVSFHVPAATAPKDSPNASSPMTSKLSLLNHCIACQYSIHFVVEERSSLTSFMFKPSGEFMLCLDNWDTKRSQC